MILRTLTVGPLDTNCYIIGCEETGIGAIIDPAAESAKIVEETVRQDLKINYIINTHGHVDHIQACESVKRNFSCPVCMHKDDEKLLKDPDLNLSSMLGSPVSFPLPDKELKEGEKIKLGNLFLLILHTPGHTPGSISIVTDKIIFTGDALFAGGVGRTDLPESNHDLLMQSIREKLFSMPDDFTIYPGHGTSSKIGTEKEMQKLEFPINN